jgi:SAM-dependent methyltransferase
MQGYRDELYGDRAAQRYDELYADFTPPAEMIALLKALSANGDAVEIGVGTGRVAIPLAKSGGRVIGVDVSSEMVDKFTENAAALDAVGLVADATSFQLERPAALIYAVFNTLYQIRGLDQQRAFLENAVRNLADNGALLLETGIFRPEYVTGPKSLYLKHLDADRVILQAVSYDAAANVIEKQEVILEQGKPAHLIPSVQYQLSQEQLLELADSCGLTLKHHYSTWSKEPFTPDSDNAITIFVKKARR